MIYLFFMYKSCARGKTIIETEVNQGKAGKRLKNSKFGQFLKKNGAVIFSICGILVIAVAVMVIVNGSIKESESDPEQEYHIDLNEMAEGDGTGDVSQIAQGENEEPDTTPNAFEEIEKPGKSQIAQGESEKEDAQVAENIQTGEQEQENVAENTDSELEAESQPIADMPPVDVAEKDETAETEFVDEAQAASSAGSSVEQKDAVDLFFEEGMEILWPVAGNVVMNYSDDHLIYHATLDQFRTHDAIAIAAEAGTEVVAAADGVVASVEESVQTGITVTTAIGNDYYLVYGQLEESELKVGDSVKQGEVIGTIAKASRFYSKEGDNLYFQVRCGEETLNPMSLLGRIGEAEDLAENEAMSSDEQQEADVATEEGDTIETAVPEE